MAAHTYVHVHVLICVSTMLRHPSSAHTTKVTDTAVANYGYIRILAKRIRSKNLVFLRHIVALPSGACFVVCNVLGHTYINS